MHWNLLEKSCCRGWPDGLQVFGYDLLPPDPDRIPASMAAMIAYVDQLTGEQSGGHINTPSITEQGNHEAEQPRHHPTAAGLTNGKDLAARGASAGENAARGKIAEPGSAGKSDMCNTGIADSLEPAEGADSRHLLLKQLGSAIASAQEKIDADKKKPCGTCQLCISGAGIRRETCACSVAFGMAPSKRELESECLAVGWLSDETHKILERGDAQEVSQGTIKALLDTYTVIKSGQLGVSQAATGNLTGASAQQECSQTSGPEATDLAEEARSEGPSADKEEPVAGAEKQRVAHTIAAAFVPPDARTEGSGEDQSAQPSHAAVQAVCPMEDTSDSADRQADAGDTVSARSESSTGPRESLLAFTAPQATDQADGCSVADHDNASGSGAIEVGEQAVEQIVGALEHFMAGFLTEQPPEQPTANNEEQAIANGTPAAVACTAPRSTCPERTQAETDKRADGTNTWAAGSAAAHKDAHLAGGDVTVGSVVSDAELQATMAMFKELQHASSGDDTSSEAEPAGPALTHADPEADAAHVINHSCSANSLEGSGATLGACMAAADTAGQVPGMESASCTSCSVNVSGSTADPGGVGYSDGAQQTIDEDEVLDIIAGCTVS